MLTYLVAQMNYWLITAQAVNPCKKDATFFGMPVWYKYLPYTLDQNVNQCRVDINITQNPQQLMLIGFALIEMLLRLGGLIAVGFVIYGGVQYVISQGEPDNTTKARNTIVNALVGLAIIIVATPLVAFIAGRVS